MIKINNQEIKLKSKLEQNKEFLHKMIDNITEADFVEANSRCIDVSGDVKTIHQIFIEKGGNVSIRNRNKRGSYFDDALKD